MLIAYHCQVLTKSHKKCSVVFRSSFFARELPHEIEAQISVSMITKTITACHCLIAAYLYEERETENAEIKISQPKSNAKRHPQGRREGGVKNGCTSL